MLDLSRLMASAAETGPSAGLVGHGLLLIVLLSMGMIVVVGALALGAMARKRARLRMLADETRAKRAEDPWRVSAERAEVPSAEELYRASGFDKDDTRIEDSPDFGEDGDGGGPKRRKPRKPDQF